MDCCAVGIAHQLSLSQISQQFAVVVKERNSQILSNLLLTNVPRWIGCNAKTLALKHLQFPDKEVNSTPPHESRVVLHWIDELLVQQNFIPDAETTFV
jgi:hypothetical protein